MGNDTAWTSLELSDVQEHAATIRSRQPLTVESDPKQWSYAISLPLELPGQRPPLVIAAHVEVRQGLVGALVVASDLKTVLARIPPPAGRGRHVLEIVLEALTPGARLVLRNNTDGDTPCVFTLEGIEVRPARSDVSSTDVRLKSVTEGHPRRLALALLHRPSLLVDGPDQRTADRGLIDIVDVSTLHQRLAFATPLEYPESSRRKDFRDWRMEDDDAPILRYLYRNFRPRRHLEFGTWAGTGACYCLEECDASVWTINLLEGELIGGKPAYSAAIDDPVEGAVPIDHGDDGPVYQTDAGLLVGRRYREAGFGHRVCQIYCDSRRWDTRAYPHDFFDSVLIDGGHTPDVVHSDTLKALSVTRPGALVMWHDFCPDPAVSAAFSSVTGVIAALAGNWPQIAPFLRDVFWVQPSFLLVGVRR